MCALGLAFVKVQRRWRSRPAVNRCSSGDVLAVWTSDTLIMTSLVDNVVNENVKHGG